MYMTCTIISIHIIHVFLSAVVLYTITIHAHVLTSSISTGLVNSLNFLSASSLLVASRRNTLSSLNTACLCFERTLISSSVKSLGGGGGATGSSASCTSNNNNNNN